MALVEALFATTNPIATATITATVATDANQDSEIAANTAAIAANTTLLNAHTTQLNNHEKLLLVLCYLQRGSSDTTMAGVIAWGHGLGLY